MMGDLEVGKLSRKEDKKNRHGYTCNRAKPQRPRPRDVSVASPSLANYQVKDSRVDGYCQQEINFGFGKICD